MFRGTCSSTEMLKGYMARESLGTPAIGGKVKTEKQKDALDKYFSRITSENAQQALEEPSHSEAGDNAASPMMLCQIVKV